MSDSQNAIEILYDIFEKLQSQEEFQEAEKQLLTFIEVSPYEVLKTCCAIIGNDQSSLPVVQRSYFTSSKILRNALSSHVTARTFASKITEEERIKMRNFYYPGLYSENDAIRGQAGLIVAYFYKISYQFDNPEIMFKELMNILREHHKFGTIGIIQAFSEIGYFKCFPRFAPNNIPEVFIFQSNEINDLLF